MDVDLCGTVYITGTQGWGSVHVYGSIHIHIHTYVNTYIHIWMWGFHIEMVARYILLEFRGWGL